MIRFRLVVWEELWRPDLRGLPDHGLLHHFPLSLDQPATKEEEEEKPSRRRAETLSLSITRDAVSRSELAASSLFPAALAVMPTEVP